MSSDSQIAIVTGSSSGIGKASAQALLAAGFTVVFTGRRAELLEAAIEEANVPKDQALAVPTDVSDPASVDALFAEVEKRYGRLDVIFNNAGNNVPSTNFGDLTYEDWKKVIDVNLSGVFLCAHGAFNLMRKQNPQGGRIINNGSISAHAPRPGSAPYTASKHGVTGLTKSIALDGRQFNIASSQIDIGNVASDMTARMAGGVPQANGTMAPEPTFNVKHVADAIVQMSSLPLDTTVQFMTIMATQMPFVGRG